jgi:Glycosyltransferase family 87
MKLDMTSDAVRRTNFSLWLYSFLVVMITAGSWIFYWLHTEFYTRPLFTKYDQFRDLTNYVGKVSHLRGSAGILGQGLPIFTYPAPAAFVYRALLSAGPGYLLAPLITLMAVCVVGLAIATWRAGHARAESKASLATAILITALLGYPLWFTIDRGNIEGVVWALSAVGLCFLLRAKYRTAAVLIGIAASIKPFPVLFLLLLLRARRYKEAALAVATAGCVTLAALTILGPNPWKAYQALKPGVTAYMADYVTNLVQIDQLRFSHSLLDGMKTAALVIRSGTLHSAAVAIEDVKLRAEPGGWHIAGELAKFYPLVAIPGFCLLLAVFYKLPRLNQLTALAVAVTLFPLSAADYTLLYLYVPFGALLVFLTREVARGKVAFSYHSALAFAVIYALLFAPLSFLTIYAGVAKLVLLIALLLVAARSPMHSAYFGEQMASPKPSLSGENERSGEGRGQFLPV